MAGTLTACVAFDPFREPFAWRGNAFAALAVGSGAL